MTRAAAPSDIELALAAVTVPSLSKAGRRVRIFSRFAFGGCSSLFDNNLSFARFDGDRLNLFGECT